MNMILIALIHASIFSIAGIGEDRGILRLPFSIDPYSARIDFVFKPEFDIINKENNIRGLFWTHPFYFSFGVPVTKGFVFALGNLERFDQSFDVYYEEDELKMHVTSKGGIDEVYAQLSNSFGIGEVSLRGSYLFGNASEVWDYNVGDYALTDSFLYRYRGKIICGGVRVKFISLAYEGLGTVEMEKMDSDTSINLPERLSIGFNPEAFGGKVDVLLEHSFWSGNNDYRSPTRFKVGLRRERVGVAYMFNPWYLKEITEHGVSISFEIPIKQFGSIDLNLGCFLKYRGSLRELGFTPEFKLTFKEIFARRKK